MQTSKLVVPRLKPTGRSAPETHRNYLDLSGNHIAEIGNIKLLKGNVRPGSVIQPGLAAMAAVGAAQLLHSSRA